MNERRDERVEVSERGGDVSCDLELEHFSEGHIIALVEQVVEGALGAELHDHDEGVRANTQE